VFVLIERRSAEPMLPGSLLRDPSRRAVLFTVLLLGAVLAGYVYFISLYLQRVLGFSAVATGVSLVPATATALLVASQVARRLLARFGARKVLLLALVLVIGGQLWLAQISATGSYQVNVLGGIIVTAAGIGLALPTTVFAITSNVPPHQRGIAGGMFVTAQQVGSAVGLAALATLAAARTEHTGALISGYRLSYLIATGLVVLALVVVVVFDRPREVT
jgi:MFS family permease